MKKCFIVLFLAIGLMSTESVLAASLDLANNFGGSVTTPSGATVEGSASGASSWVLSVDTDSLVDFDLDSGSFFSILGGNGLAFVFNTDTFQANLVAGSYLFAILPGLANVPYTFSVSVAPVVGAIPVPGALWLFGSAFLGMIGTLRRKSHSAPAA